MSEAHRRKKNPELVRAQLVESAKRLALENGLAAVSLDSVATDAGVTKGGLLHHFQNKKVLVDAVFQHLLEELEADLTVRMASDEDRFGRFTRAYVQSVFDTGAEAQWGALWVATLTDPHLRRTWGEWFNDQLSKHDEPGLALETARLAADGIWLGHLFGVAPEDPEAFQRHLVAMTRERQ